MADLEEILSSLIQTSPEDLSTRQKVLRTFTKLIPPSILKNGDKVDLADMKEFELVTDFEGPWRLSSIGIKFTLLSNGEEVPNLAPKDFAIRMVLGGEEFDLVERFSWRGKGFALTDPIKFGAEDQIKVWVRGDSGFAAIQIRGEKL